MANIYLSIMICHKSNKKLKSKFIFPHDKKDPPHTVTGLVILAIFTLSSTARTKSSEVFSLQTATYKLVFYSSQALSGRASISGQAALMASPISFLPGGSRWRPSRASSVFSSPFSSYMPGVMSICTCERT